MYMQLNCLARTSSVEIINCRCLMNIESRIHHSHAKTTFEHLANLEHELRLSRHPVRLGRVAGKHHPHLQVSRGKRRKYSTAVARRSADWLHCPTDHWRGQ